MKIKETVVLSVLVLGLGAGIYFAANPSRGAGVNILEFRPPLPAAAPWNFPGRSILARLRAALFGQRGGVTINTVIVDSYHPEILADMSLPQPPNFSNRDGLLVWILDRSDLRELGKRLQQAGNAASVFTPSVVTWQGRQTDINATHAVMLNGTNQNIGYSLNFLPQIRGKGVDLTSTLFFTEIITNRPAASLPDFVSLRTNLAVSARFQVPAGRGLFLLQSNRLSSGGKITGVMISPTVERPLK